MELRVFPLNADRKDDFYEVHNEKHGSGWCFCVAWWTITWDAWSLRTAEENRQRREQLFEIGHYDGYLLYADGEPIGWCQCGLRDRLIKLRDQYKLPRDTDAWAITCFFIIPEYREIGLAHYFVGEILKDLKSKSVKYVQGFPKRGKNLSVDNVWTGPEGIFIKAGFELEQDHPAFPVYRKILND